MASINYHVIYSKDNTLCKETLTKEQGKKSG
jgi:hypothetical protein